MSTPKNLAQENRRQLNKHEKDTLPPDWEFGQIKEVDPDTYLVKVVIFREGTQEIPGWHPIIKGQDTIRILQEQYGKITDGMCCIVHWRGTAPESGKTFIQVIGKGPGCGGDTMIAEQRPVENELPTGAFRIFSGGMIP